MTLANYLRMEAAVALLDGVDEILAEKVRDRMDVVWQGLSPHDIAWLNSRSAPIIKTAQPTAKTFRCDYEGCANLPIFECDCSRCRYEDKSGKFYACKGHENSSAIEAKHRRIYPNHQLSFVEL